MEFAQRYAFVFGVAALLDPREKSLSFLKLQQQVGDRTHWTATPRSLLCEVRTSPPFAHVCSHPFPLQQAMSAAAKVVREEWENELRVEFEGRAANPDAAAAAAPATVDEGHREKRARLEQQAQELEDEGRLLEASSVRAQARKMDAPAVAHAPSAEDYVRSIVGQRSIEDEVSAWLKEPEVPFADCADVFAWWAANERRFPTIARLAKFYLVLPATSIDVERLFSKLQHLVDPTRTSLSEKRICQVLVINDSIACFPDALRDYQQAPAE